MVKYRQKVITYIKIIFDLLFTVLLPILIWVEYGIRYGLPVMILCIIIILLLRGWKSRHIFLFQIRRMEEVIYGKTLDKDNWEKGELKQLKLKPEWRKKEK